MKNTRADLLKEIHETREKLYAYIEKYGMDNTPALMEINVKLDELILKWIKNY